MGMVATQHITDALTHRCLPSSSMNVFSFKVRKSLIGCMHLGFDIFSGVKLRWMALKSNLARTFDNAMKTTLVSSTNVLIIHGLVPHF